MQDCKTLIIGAGITGLAAAETLRAAGRSFHVLEASDRAGGRVRTDVVTNEHGQYLLDRGFQVYLTAYPEAGRLLDLDDLDLQTFDPGALVRLDGKFHKVSDPFRQPAEALRMFGSPIASLDDKVRLGLLDRKLKAGSPEDAWNRPERSTIEALREAGFKDQAIDRFFRPFFGGVFFDRSLETSSRMFEFTYRMFATGHAAVPKNGMGAIADQLVRRIGANKITLGVEIESLDITPEGVLARARDGTEWSARSAIAASALRCKIQGAPVDEPEWQAMQCVWFDAPKDTLSPLTNGRPRLLLEAETSEQRPANHVAVLSDVSPNYAPENRSLIAASIVLGTQQQPTQTELTADSPPVARCREQIASWVGVDPTLLTPIGMQHIDRALPCQIVGRDGSLTPPSRSIRIDERVILCGDAYENASINGAVRSGTKAARTLFPDP